MGLMTACRNCLLEVLALGSFHSEWLSVFLQCLSTSDSPRGISETVEALPLLGLWKLVHTIVNQIHSTITCTLKQSLIIRVF